MTNVQQESSMDGWGLLHVWAMNLLTPGRWAISQRQTQPIPSGCSGTPCTAWALLLVASKALWPLSYVWLRRYPALDAHGQPVCCSHAAPSGKGHKHHLPSTGVGRHKGQHNLAGLSQGPIVAAQLCGDSHLHRRTGRPRLRRQPFTSWHRLIYEKLLLAGANLSGPRIMGELLLGIKPESHKTWVSLQILLESTAVAMSSSLCVEDTRIPAEFWPAKWQELEPCNQRTAIVMSILFNSVHVHTFVWLPCCHVLLIPTANLCSLLIPHLHFSARVKTRSEYFFPFSLTTYVTNRTFQNFCQSPSVTAWGIL